MFQFTEPVIKEEVEVPPQSFEEKKPVGEENIEGEEDNGPPVDIPVQVQEIEEKDEAALSFAEEMPAFANGGEAGFQKYLAEHINYPQMEKDQGKEGTVYVYFEVGKDGSIGNVKTVKAVPGAPGFSREAERVIKGMPKWTPGKMNGRDVKVSMTVPVKFVLQ